MQIKIKDSKDNQFYFTIVASNGEPIATSEMYTKKEKCHQTIALIIKECNSIEVGDYTQKRKTVIRKAQPEAVKKPKAGMKLEFDMSRISQTKVQ